VQELLDKNDQAVIRAMHAIQDRQTADEQAGHTTRHTNGVGWSKFDAEWMSEMIIGYRRWGRLTPKQMAITRNKVKRYWRQLCEIANEKEAVVQQPAIQELDETAAESAAIAAEEAAYHAAENKRDMEQEYERMRLKFEREMQAGSFA
jgi:hypothetical protein